MVNDCAAGLSQGRARLRAFVFVIDGDCPVRGLKNARTKAHTLSAPNITWVAYRARVRVRFWERLRLIVALRTAVACEGEQGELPKREPGTQAEFCERDAPGSRVAHQRVTARSQREADFRICDRQRQKRRATIRLQAFLFAVHCPDMGELTLRDSTQRSGPAASRGKCSSQLQVGLESCQATPLHPLTSAL